MKSGSSTIAIMPATSVTAIDRQASPAARRIDAPVIPSAISGIAGVVTSRKRLAERGRLALGAGEREQRVAEDDDDRRDRRLHQQGQRRAPRWRRPRAREVALAERPADQRRGGDGEADAGAR